VSICAHLWFSSARLRLGRTPGWVQTEAKHRGKKRLVITRYFSGPASRFKRALNVALANSNHRGGGVLGGGGGGYAGGG
jgi:hypothetical protein